MPFFDLKRSGLAETNRLIPQVRAELDERFLKFSIVTGVAHQIHLVPVCQNDRTHFVQQASSQKIVDQRVCHSGTVSVLTISLNRSYYQPVA